MEIFRKTIINRQTVLQKRLQKKETTESEKAESTIENKTEPAKESNITIVSHSLNKDKDVLIIELIIILLKRF